MTPGKKLFLSTSIPYVNGAPHIGHALEYVQADTISRLARISGYDVIFTTGSDENAMKNIESAEKVGKSVQDFVDEKVEQFRTLCAQYQVAYDIFIRTTSPEHHLGCQKLWKLSAKDIYKKKYSGLYCVGCETFYEEGEFPDNICPNHNRKLELVEEENYFFALSRYQKQIEKLLESEELKIFPTYRRDELLNFVKKGLQDFSISRPSARLKGWGVPVPGDESQRMYVWYDALTNYVTALGFGGSDESKYERYWVGSQARIHCIGKDIIKFHGIYWPAMLLSAGVPLPTHLFTHGFLTSGGHKMSKTLGNVIDPFELTQRYSLDAIRYYLLREIPPHDDGDFSHTRMKQLYMADLANELGNLVSRLCALAAADGIEVAGVPLTHTIDSQVHAVIDYQATLVEVWDQVKEINKGFNVFMPWKKDAASRKDFLEKSLSALAQIGTRLVPYMPDIAACIVSACTGKIVKIAPLFPRIEESK